MILEKKRIEPASGAMTTKAMAKLVNAIISANDIYRDLRKIEGMYEQGCAARKIGSFFPCDQSVVGWELKINDWMYGPKISLEDILNEISCKSFLDRAQRLDDQGKSDEALDIVYDEVDRFLRKSSFSQLDALLKKPNTERLSIDILIALLTATYPAKSKLSSRKELFKNAEIAIQNSGEDPASLLQGLEN